MYLLARTGVLAVALFAACVLLREPAIAAQSSAAPRRAFDVASVKVNKSGSTERFGGFQPGGRFRASNVPLRQIIAWVYGDAFPVADQQIVGGPGWIDQDRFDIDARAEGDAPRDGMQKMLETLLAERFKLVSHPETRELPVYHLIHARPDGKIGAGLRSSSGDDCAVPGRAAPAGMRVCGSVGFVGGRGVARDATLDAVARFLVPAVGRIVVNRTGMDGRFSFDFEFAPTLPAASFAATSGLPADDRPSLFTALTEQLGLKLEASRTAIAVLVIDRVERPAEN